MIRPLANFTPVSFYEHIKNWKNLTLTRYHAKKEAKRKKPARPWSWRVTTKGTFMITIRKRTPKYLTRTEYETLLTEVRESKHPIAEITISNYIEKKKIIIK